ncbi:MAG: glucose-6-phosphate dehydrogenase [Patescibacteria group bacterium]
MSQRSDSLPTIFVIFGATGDLASKKILPALYRLHAKKLLPPLFQIVAFSRQQLTPDDFRKKVRELPAFKNHRHSSSLTSFLKLITYTQGVFGEKKGYENLATLLGAKDQAWRTCANKLFYLSTSPEHYVTIFNHLKSFGLTIPCSPEEGWTRVVVEKPFGKDTKTAEALDLLMGKLFKEEQIYRIDHYLGKETVQNILAFRFSNSIFEPAWNHNHIEAISVRVLEKDGIGSRGEFYDATGALRDFGQNHLLQLLALFTMDNPGTLDAKKIHRKRAEIIQALQPFTLKDVAQHSVRGQYAGYKKQSTISPRSLTETYFRLQANLTTPRWKGVRVYLESGKKMFQSLATVTVTFKSPTPCLCPAIGETTHYQNVLKYHIQPDEKIKISFWVKKPGTEMLVEERDFEFDYKRAYPGAGFLDPYDKLLQDVIEGNQTLFVSTEEIKASWQFIDPIVRGWKRNATPLIIYKPGQKEMNLY